MEFEARELLDSEKAVDLFSDYEGGFPRKDYTPCRRSGPMSCPPSSTSLASIQKPPRKNKKHTKYIKN